MSEVPYSGWTSPKSKICISHHPLSSPEIQDPGRSIKRHYGVKIFFVINISQLLQLTLDMVPMISRNVAATVVVLHILKFYHLIQIKEPFTGDTLLKRGCVCTKPGLCSNHISSGVPVICIPPIFFLGGEEKALGRRCWTGCEQASPLEQHSPCINWVLRELHNALYGFLWAGLLSWWFFFNAVL